MATQELYKPGAIVRGEMSFVEPLGSFVDLITDEEGKLTVATQEC